MGEASLEVTHLCVQYGRARILRGVNLEVQEGQVVGLVGPNGAGKTTTLRTISGLVPRSSGTILFGGEPLPARAERVARRGVLHVPEGRGLMPSLTVRDNLRYGAMAVRQKCSADDFDFVTDMFPALQPLMDRRASFLSGGEQQMVAIGRGIMARPRILMVDELSLGLSPKLVRDVLARLVKAAQVKGTGLLLVDQNVRALTTFCDKMYVLSDGLAQLATPGEDNLVMSVYFGGSGSKAPDGFASQVDG